MRVCGVVLLWCLTGLSYAETLEVSSAEDFRADPWSHLRILEHATSKQTVEHVHAADGFRTLPGDKGPLYIPAERYPAWLRLDLTNPEDAPVHLIWEMRVQSVERLDFYYKAENGWQRIPGGSQIPFGERDVRVFANVFRFALPPGEHAVYVHAEGSRSVHIRTTLYNESSYLVANHWQSWFSGILRGISLGLLCFTFLLFVRTRDLVYAAFSALILFNVAYRGYYEGFAQWLLPGAANWNLVAFSVCFHAYLAAAAWFHTVYLNLAHDLPKIHRITIALTGVFVTAALTSLFFPAATRTYLAPLTIAAPLFFVIGALWQWRNGYQPAATYLLALLFPLSTGAIAAAGGAGLFHLDESFRNLDRAAGSIGLILFAIGIADRIKLLDNAKRLAEQNALTAHAEARAKIEFLAKMSHEIRTPMNGVLGMVQLLRQGPLDESQARYARIIHNSSQSLLHIINDLLDFSKAEAGKLELEQMAFDVRELCEACIAMFTAVSGDKAVTLSWQVDDEVPDFVRGDPNRLRQILINLLGNALKFTEEGEVTLSVRQVEDSPLLEFSVADSGIGIPQDAQRRLFQAFNQASVSTAREYGGTGLGLSICRELVELMGGNIRVESVPGEGATFLFTATLPACDAPPQTEDGDAGEADTETPLSILLVDDNRVNLQVAAAMLKKLGHRVTTAIDGENGAACFEADYEGVDLVLMDCEMPGMDGFAATRVIREFEDAEDLPAVPVIALTGHALADIESRLDAAGMQAHLMKPLQLEHISALLESQQEAVHARRHRLEAA